MKTCTMCTESKKESEFYLGFRRGTPYLYARCKSCCKILNDSYKAQGRDWELKKKYGISLEEYKLQCSTRENHCDICHKYNSCLHVDHNHQTGKVRGYLCGSCNRGIGLLKDDPVVLKSAAQYLETND